MLFLNKFTSREPQVERFFALNIGEEKIRAAVWLVNQRRTEIVKPGQNETWDGKTQESLLAAADRSLSAAAEGLKPEPTGVIFGLPEPWIDKETVAADKKPWLKYICKELELKPLGFVTVESAIIAYLKIEEGTPLSAVLIQVSAAEINLTLVRLGQTVGSQLVGRSGDLGADTEEGLSRFDKVEALPPRLILFNGGGDFEDDKQQLLSYDWEEKLPFIHFPKVEVLDSEATVKAVALAGGGEAAGALGLGASRTAADLGFVSGRDAAEKEKAEKAEKAEEAVKEGKPKQKIKVNFRPMLEKMTMVLAKLPRSRLPVIIGGGFVLLAVGLFLAYWYIPKARVVIYLEPQLVNQELRLSLEGPGAAGGGPPLPAEAKSVSVSGSRSRPASGNKVVGDPAKGGITIYNKTAATQSFAAGTILLGPDKLAFGLDEEVTVASRSAEEDSEGVITITPGKAEAGITAVNIGPESNLAAETRLSFKQFSEDNYYAKTSGLSGGTAREAKAVDDQDLADLETALTEELAARAKEELGRSLADDQRVAAAAEKTTLSEKDFSAAAGDEAGEVSLSAKLEFRGYIYRQTDLDRLLAEAVKEKIPENFLVSEFSGVAVEINDEGEAVVAFTARLLPRLEISEIKQKLRGRYPEQVEAYLADLPRFVSAEILIRPNLPKKIKTLPRPANNIILEIKPAP